MPGWSIRLRIEVSERDDRRPDLPVMSPGGDRLQGEDGVHYNHRVKAHYLGHVVWYVRDLARSLGFYRDLLGFAQVGRAFDGRAAALTGGRTHHELLLIEVGDAPAPPAGRRLGLYHIGVKIGDSLDALRAAKSELERAGVVIDGMSDHTASQSLYCRDPDGNEVELYVDADPAVWKDHPEAVLSPVRPLVL